MNTMTHYMELLASNQPWNIIIFMVIPVVCAETLAISEFMVLFSRDLNGKARHYEWLYGYEWHGRHETLNKLVMVYEK